jgi:hypothetical protein
MVAFGGTKGVLREGRVGVDLAAPVAGVAFGRGARREPGGQGKWETWRSIRRPGQLRSCVHCEKVGIIGRC